MRRLYCLQKQWSSTSKNGLSLPAKADQWSFKTQNGKSEAECLLSFWPPVFTLWHLLTIPVSSHSLPLTHSTPRGRGELRKRPSSWNRVTAAWERWLILSHLRCWSVCLLIITHLDIMWCVFVSFALLFAEITGSISALWNNSQLSGLPCICRDMNIR